MPTEPTVLRIDHPAEGLDGLLGEVIARLAPEVCVQSIASSDPRHHLYVGRLRVCVLYHAERLREDEGRATGFEWVIGRLERGDFGGVKVRANLLRDVVLAQALQLGEPRAAEVFEVEFMPVVRSIARHLDGERAIDAVENFAAELMLPREGREPRIATYQGRTALAHWLGPVVTNALRTELRRRKPDVPILFEPNGRESPIARLQPAVELDQCEELLRPIFLTVGRLLDPEDRLLLQMLMLDGVPQKDLARSLGLNSGTITRRRQRAVETILSGTRRLAAQCSQPRQAEDCLGLLLAGHDPELRRGLADVLASGVRAGSPS
jgi:RNA polymerase sigma factor (sigma-70 family)